MVFDTISDWNKSRNDIQDSKFSSNFGSSNVGSQVAGLNTNARHQCRVAMSCCGEVARSISFRAAVNL